MKFASDLVPAAEKSRAVSGPALSTLVWHLASDVSLHNDHERPHHVVLLVLEDVAVPDVFVDPGPRAGAAPGRHQAAAGRTS